MLTVALLQAAGVDYDTAKQWAQPLQAACEQYGINTPLRVAHFLAQVLEESQLLSRLTENLNYRTPSRLVEVWPSRFTLNVGELQGSKRYAPNYVNSPEKLANAVYANRMGNGDEASGDGWAYRGQGLLMFTGRALYAAYRDYAGHDVVSNPNLLLEPNVSADAAAWFFAVYAGLLEDADQDDLHGVTLRINGGYTNLEARQTYLKKLKQALKNLPSPALPTAKPVPEPLPELVAAEAIKPMTPIIEVPNPTLPDFKKPWHAGWKTHIYMGGSALLGILGMFGFVPGLSVDTSANLIKDALAVSGLRAAAPYLVAILAQYATNKRG